MGTPGGGKNMDNSAGASAEAVLEVIRQLASVIASALEQGNVIREAKIVGEGRADESRLRGKKRMGCSRGDYGSLKKNKCSECRQQKPTICNYCKREGHTKWECPKLGRSKLFQQSQGPLYVPEAGQTGSSSSSFLVGSSSGGNQQGSQACYYCKQGGHMKRSCPKLTKGQSGINILKGTI